MISHSQILESVELTCMLLLLMFTLRSEPGDYWNCFPRGNKFSLPLGMSVCVCFLFLVTLPLKKKNLIAPLEMSSALENIPGTTSVIFNLSTLGQKHLGGDSSHGTEKASDLKYSFLSQILVGHIVLEDFDITDGCDGCFLHNLQPNSCHAVQI